MAIKLAIDNGSARYIIIEDDSAKHRYYLWHVNRATGTGSPVRGYRGVDTYGEAEALLKFRTTPQSGPSESGQMYA